MMKRVFQLRAENVVSFITHLESGVCVCVFACVCVCVCVWRRTRHRVVSFRDGCCCDLITRTPGLLAADRANVFFGSRLCGTAISRYSSTGERWRVGDRGRLTRPTHSM